MAREKVRLLHGANIVSMDGEMRVFMDGAIIIVGNRIEALGKKQIMEEYVSQVDEIVDLSNRWILPGLVNTHVHTSQQLARGIADDVDLLTWLHERIWPFESNMTEEDSYISTLLTGIELVHSGVTCFAEAGGQHVAGMARAIEELGIRACLTRSTMDSGEGLPEAWATETLVSCLKVQEDLYWKFNGQADGRIRIWFGLRQILNSSDDLLVQTKQAADKFKTGIHMHVAEIPFENEMVVKTREVDHGTVTHLNTLGILGENLLAAHCVWVDDTEGWPRWLAWHPKSLRSQIKKLAAAGVKVSHCPAAAMRMLGFAPIKEMLEEGLCVSLGTDGAPSNNRMSLVDEMYLASLINKGKVVYQKGNTDPTALPAETILRMATVEGSKAVLMGNEIGTLEVGKKADLVIVNPHLWTMLPLHDPISSLVYCMRTENIESVMCNGQWIMKNHKILTVDEATIQSKAQHAAVGVITRSGIQVPRRMKFI